MGKTTGFIEIARRKPPARPIAERIRDWNEVYLPYSAEDLRNQGARCMDCSVPFCHHGCPLGNVIPDWNDLVYRDRWQRGIDRLHATNNFPEFTGRLCPAPCEGSCVLGINDDPVTIRGIELALIERAFDEGWIAPRPPARRTGKQVAIVGSGPAGLAAADQLNRAGHAVTVFERADRIGGLLRYGIPAFKLEKRFLDRRLAVLEAEGIVFRPRMHIGVDVPVDMLQRGFDAALLAGGSTVPRDLQVPGRELAGIHLAMEYLTQQNRIVEGDVVPADEAISAEGKRVVIIGGGDTGADCLGTALRQGARSVHQFELLPRPPDQRGPDNPWPEWPNVFRVSSAHEEGGERLYAVSTEAFSGDGTGRVQKLHAVGVKVARYAGQVRIERLSGTEFDMDVDLVLLAMGFVGPAPNGLLSTLGVELTARGTVRRDANWMTSVPGVFTAGDMQRGQSLIVWAMAEGRSAARGIDHYLTGTSTLVAPV
jgi:glutamate synthase (NADPH) small chain